MQIKGEVHHDRRLHQLMLLEASKEWARCVKARGLNLSANRSIKADERDASEQRRVSCDSHARTASSPTDSVSSLHDSLLHDFRCLASVYLRALSPGRVSATTELHSYKSTV